MLHCFNYTGTVCSRYHIGLLFMDGVLCFKYCSGIVSTVILHILSPLSLSLSLGSVISVRAFCSLCLLTTPWLPWAALLVRLRYVFLRSTAEIVPANKPYYKLKLNSNFPDIVWTWILKDADLVFHRLIPWELFSLTGAPRRKEW